MKLPAAASRISSSGASRGRFIDALRTIYSPTIIPGGTFAALHGFFLILRAATMASEVQA